MIARIFALFAVLFCPLFAQTHAAADLGRQVTSAGLDPEQCYRVHDVEICDPLRDRLEQSGCRKSNPDIFVMQSAEDWAEYVLPFLRCAIGAHPCPRPGACASHYSSERKISETGVDVPRPGQ